MRQSRKEPGGLIRQMDFGTRSIFPGIMISPALLKIDPEVSDAISSGAPIVALESTIITHGMPFPENLATAQQVEGVVREHGAIPATIAILDGQVCVGLQEVALQRLATAKDVAKVSRRDLASLLVKGNSGGTTVASTMLIAASVGIAVFATGGIGGVHRGAEQSFDISADLAELASTPVSIVCAGAKSILDIAKTLEYLETQGVPVLGYQTDDFPGFYTRKSGYQVDYRFDSPSEIAKVIRMQRALGLRGGIVITNPVPEHEAIPMETMEDIIAQAVEEAKAQGILGKKLTPFLLRRISDLTQGASLTTNIALIKNNASLGARIAVELAAQARGVSA